MKDNVGETQIQKALEYFGNCIANHREYGEYFNYESFSREQLKLEGRGFVLLDATDFVKGFLDEVTQVAEVKHKYFTFNFVKKWEAPLSKMVKRLSQYDETRQYVVLLFARTSADAGVFVPGFIELTPVVRPTRITSSQIRKRLNRMIQQGIRLLVLDTNNPDCAGTNLEKWLSEVKALERQGKHINVIIDSDNESSALIPPRFKEDICTINFK